MNRKQYNPMETILTQWFKNQNAVTQSKLEVFVFAKLTAKDKVLIQNNPNKIRTESKN